MPYPIRLINTSSFTCIGVFNNYYFLGKMAKNVKKMANSAISELPLHKSGQGILQFSGEAIPDNYAPPPPPASQKKKTVPQKSTTEVILSKKKASNAQKHINK